MLSAMLKSSVRILLTSLSAIRSLVQFPAYYISCDGPVSVDGHVPWNGDAILLGDSLGFMLIPSFLHLKAKLFADLPVHLFSCLVEALDS